MGNGTEKTDLRLNMQVDPNSWWLNGKRHREDGPAFEDADGYQSYGI